MEIDETQYAELVNHLRTSIKNESHTVISIDGPCASGKSTLARYLAFRLHIPIIETDLFWRVEGKEHVGFHDDQIARILDFCRCIKRSVILEGFDVEKRLTSLERQPDIRIFVKREGSPNAVEANTKQVKSNASTKGTVNYIFYSSAPGAK